MFSTMALTIWTRITFFFFREFLHFIIVAKNKSSFKEVVVVELRCSEWEGGGQQNSEKPQNVDVCMDIDIKDVEAFIYKGGHHVQGGWGKQIWLNRSVGQIFLAAK